MLDYDGLPFNPESFSWHKIISEGILNYSDLTLISDDYNNSDNVAVGDFELELNSSIIRVISNKLSSFYLSGNVKAWGILQNRSGKVTRQFSADLNGAWDGKQLILDEKFNWSDGEIQTRQWIINKIDDHNYEGTAGDVVGTAKGYSYGPASVSYTHLTLPTKA